MSDYIKREDARRILTDFINVSKNPVTLNNVVDLVSKIHLLPDADVRENVRGEWVQAAVCKHKPYRIRNTDKWTTYKCFNCGYSNGRRFNANFCPNCGADMRGENNEI